MKQNNYTIACLAGDLATSFPKTMRIHLPHIQKQLHAIKNDTQIDSKTLENYVRIIEAVVDDDGQRMDLAMVKDFTASLVRLAHLF